MAPPGAIFKIRWNISPRGLNSKEISRGKNKACNACRKSSAACRSGMRHKKNGAQARPEKSAARLIVSQELCCGGEGMPCRRPIAINMEKKVGASAENTCPQS